MSYFHPDRRTFPACQVVSLRLLFLTPKRCSNEYKHRAVLLLQCVPVPVDMDASVWVATGVTSLPVRMPENSLVLGNKSSQFRDMSDRGTLLLLFYSKGNSWREQLHISHGFRWLAKSRGLFNLFPLRIHKCISRSAGVKRTKITTTYTYIEEVCYLGIWRRTEQKVGHFGRGSFISHKSNCNFLGKPFYGAVKKISYNFSKMCFVYPPRLVTYKAHIPCDHVSNTCDDMPKAIRRLPYISKGNSPLRQAYYSILFY